MRTKAYVEDVQVGDIIYISNAPTTVLEVERVPLKSRDDYKVRIVHEQGTLVKGRRQCIRLKPAYVSPLIEWPRYKQDVPTKLAEVIDSAVKLDNYYRNLEAYKKGSRICECGTIVPKNTYCGYCGKYAFKDSHLRMLNEDRF